MSSFPPSSVASRSAFISHSSADIAMGQQLCRQMEARGVRCWIAPRNLDPGAPYADEIVRGIQNCDSLVLLATSTAVVSNNVLNEVEQAHKRHKTLFTVMVGHPGVTAQLDYYISRLHWIESQNGTMDDVAERLADVLTGQKNWPDVATPPSLSRRLAYDRRALFASLTGALVVVATTAVGAWLYQGHRQHELAMDYRSLGWVTVGGDAVPPNSGGERQVQMQIWLGDESTPVRDVHLTAVATNASAQSTTEDLTTRLPVSSGGVLTFTYAVPSSLKRLTTCLGVPSSSLHKRYTVVQQFNAVGSEGSAALEQVAAPKVMPAQESAAGGKGCL